MSFFQEKVLKKIKRKYIHDKWFDDDAKNEETIVKDRLPDYLYELLWNLKTVQQYIKEKNILGAN